LQGLTERYPDVFGPVRGRGLMLGLPVLAPYLTKAFVAIAREHEALIINGAGDNTLRFVPPLIVSAAQIDDALARLERTVRYVCSR
jgi:acetylornithine/N-succinyldiaminopimelate aminotransferase